MNAIEILTDADMRDIGWVASEASEIQSSQQFEAAPHTESSMQPYNRGNTFTTVKDSGEDVGLWHQMAAFQDRLADEQSRLTTLQADIEILRSSLRTAEAASKHPAVALRDSCSRATIAARLGKNTTINQRHDALRAELMTSGVWYENVDSLITYCEDSSASYVGGTESDMILRPDDTYPLRLHKATCLASNLGLANDLLAVEPVDADVLPQAATRSATDEPTLQLVNRPLKTADQSRKSMSKKTAPKQSPHQVNDPLVGYQIGVKATNLKEAAHNFLHITTGNPPDLVTDEEVFHCLQQPGFVQMLGDLDLSTSRRENSSRSERVHAGRRVNLGRVESTPTPATYDSKISKSKQSALAAVSVASTGHISFAHGSDTTIERLPPISVISTYQDKDSLTPTLTQSIRSRSSSLSSVNSSTLDKTPGLSARDSDRSRSSSSLVRSLNASQLLRSRRSGRMVLWTDDEEHVFLTILRALFENRTPKSTRFSIASKQLADRGYERTASSLSQRWSLRLRQLCIGRGDHWAAEDATESQQQFRPLQTQSSQSENADESPDAKSTQETVGKVKGLKFQSRSKLKSDTETGPVDLGVVQPGSSRSGTVDRPADIRMRSLTKQIQPKLNPSSDTALEVILSSVLRGGRYLRKPGSVSALAQLKSCADHGLQHMQTFTGASLDIINVAWSPDGTRYAAGSAALTDERNLHYNRPNNLLFGDITSNSIHELPDHFIARHSDTDPASQARTYTTISALHWSSSGQLLYSSSYDETVKVWDVQGYSVPKCIATLKHNAKVEVMAVARDDVNLLVTGTISGNRSLRGYYANSDGSNYAPFKLDDQRGKKTFLDSPNCIKFGANHEHRHYLAAGFGDPAINDDGTASNLGFLGLWRYGEGHFVRLNVSPRTEAIFDIVWSPDSSLFATGNAVPVPVRKVPRVRTSVRLYSISDLKARLELGAPALDINDVTFCPFREQYITASCTDGSTYCWDVRKPNSILHKLSHGLPACELDRTIDREISDVGVRMAVWGNDSGQFYTGASDGVLKQWDIRKGTADVLTQNVASFGVEIMCGRFSPDNSHLLIGDASGSLQILSKSLFGSQDEVREINFVRAGRSFRHGYGPNDSEPALPAGDAARELVRSGQITIHPTFGPGKGQMYSGPFARWARPAVSEEHLPFTDLLPDVQSQQRDQTSYNLKRPHAKDATNPCERNQKVGRPDPLKISSLIAKFSKQDGVNDLTDETDMRNIVSKLSEEGRNHGDQMEPRNRQLISTWPDDTDRITPDDSVDENVGLTQHTEDRVEVDCDVSDEDDDFWFPPNWAVNANFEVSQV